MAATLDEASGCSGLLVVSGGNETRAGAFAGQAELAGRIAASGHPVFRFDRRGVGDSSGVNRGFRGSGPDILSAVAAFRKACPALTRIVAFGNCDAAAALMLTGGDGCDALALANPWTFEDGTGLNRSPAAVRARYAARLRNPRDLARLISGRVSFRKLADGLRVALRPASQPGSLVEEMASALGRFEGPVQFLVAGQDRTAQAFLSAWDRNDPRIARCDGASHAFVEPEAREWLFQRLLATLNA